MFNCPLKKLLICLESIKRLLNLIRQFLSIQIQMSQQNTYQKPYQPQSGSSTRVPAQNIPSQSNINPNDYEGRAIEQTLLEWSSLGQGQNDVIISGESDIGVLKNLKNILLSLQNQFLSRESTVVLSEERKKDFDKRLILLEREIEGLMKRKIQYSARDAEGTRVLDYSNILNQKETQIVELQKKINNLEERLRRSSAREIELENHISRIYGELKRKDDLLLAKNEIIMSEVAASNALRESVNKLRKNIDNNRSRMGQLERMIMEGVNFPEVGSFEIKSDLLTQQGASSRSKTYQGQSPSRRYKTQLIALFRQFERLNSSDGISDVELEKALQGFLIGLGGSKLKESVETSIARWKMEEDMLKLKDQFGVAVGIMQTQIDKWKQQTPNIRMEIDPKIFQMLRTFKINVLKTSGDVVHLERYSQKVVQVPVQDARTKHLMHLLAVQMKKFTTKYPKLMDEMDNKLTEFFQQEMIDVIEVDQVDRLVEIVKYVPQVVKVENVYAYSNEKSRKVEFHLRILVKALLEELEKIRMKTGAVLQIDEGIIGMINQQIMGVVDVDDILKVFRVVPKIVQVEKIVEKIVDRVVEVPNIIPVEKIIEKIVEIEKIREVERIVNVPLEVPTIVNNVVEKIVPVERVIERVVEIPMVVERIIEVIKEIPKTIEIQKIIQKPVEVEKVIEVERVVNQMVPEIQTIEVIVEKVVVTEKIVQKIVEVPVIVEKIVQKIVQVPQIVEVQKIVEKIVPQIEYRNAKQIQNHIEVRNNIVERIVEKPIPIIQTVERIVEVPQTVEKIVQKTVIVKEVQQVEVIREKIVFQDRIKEVQRIVEVPVEVVKEVFVEVQKIVKVPFVHERIVKVQEIVEKPIIQRSEITVVKQVLVRQPLVIYQQKPVQVQKIINHFIDVPKPIKYIEETIVEVIRHVDRIKEIKVPVEKIIEKMVQVPKVVEVERIVEKIVVVPRVVEKVVQVPQIIERVIPKIVIEERIKEIQKRVEVPVIQERLIQIEVPKNVYIEVEKVVDRVVDKLVEVPQYQEKIINNEVVTERVVEVVREVPREMEVQRLVHNRIQVPKVVEINKQIIVPIEVPFPIEKLVQKIVPTVEIVQKIVQVPQIVDRIVIQRVQHTQIKEIERIEERIVVDTKIKEVVREVPYIRDQIKAVQTIVEKIVPIQSITQQIVTAQQIVQKVVQKSTVVPKVYQVQRLREKVIEVPKIVEVEKIIPQLVNVNRYIQNIVEKIVEVPIIVEKIKEIVKENQIVVETKNEIQTIKEVQKIVEKAVIMEKFKEVVRNVNHIEKVLEIVQRFEQNPVEIVSYEEKLVEVPYILEKIVEKIVVMPQIVEVLKYVHEVVEEQTPGVAVDVDFASHEQKYKLLTKEIQNALGVLLSELLKIKGTNPALKMQIEMVQKFLGQLKQFILVPRIVEVVKEKIVNNTVSQDRIVSLPQRDQRSIKMELTLSLLVEKLIVQIKRLKQQNPGLALNLDDDVRLIFFQEIGGGSKAVSEDLNAKLKSFSESVYRKFESLGGWSLDHQMMLNSFLQERFMMASLIRNANLQIQKARNISYSKEEAVQKYQTDVGVMQNFLTKIRNNLRGIPIEQESILDNIFKDFDSFISTRIIGQPTKILSNLQQSENRVDSQIREKEALIVQLKDRIFSLEKNISHSKNDSQSKIVQAIESQNQKLKNEINELMLERGSSKLIASYKQQIEQLNGRIMELQQQKSNLNSQLSNLKRQFDLRLSIQGGGFDGKGSNYTKQRSQMKGSELVSPMQKYNFSSPNSGQYGGIEMVQSKIQGGNGGTSGNFGPTYGTKLTQSRHSSSSRDQPDSGNQAGSGNNYPSATFSTQIRPQTATGAVGQSGARTTGPGQSNIYPSGSGQSALGQSNTKKSDLGQSGLGQSGLGQSGMSGSKYGQSDLSQSGLSQGSYKTTQQPYGGQGRTNPVGGKTNVLESETLQRQQRPSQSGSYLPSTSQQGMYKPSNTGIGGYKLESINQGQQGSQGSASQGYQGAQGYQGYQGTQSQGYSGNQGQGYTGNQGQGNQGYSYRSNQGQGYQGNQGYQSYQGNQGQGTQGQGYQGNQSKGQGKDGGKEGQDSSGYQYGFGSQFQRK